MKYVLAIDQSTSATKAVLFDTDKRLVARCDKPHRQIVNERGWVGHDPSEIMCNVYTAAREALHVSGVRPEDVACVSLSNQRETAVAWDRATGAPICEGIVWQCARASAIAARIAGGKNERLIYERTGLRLSPFFSGPKYAWILDNVEGAADMQAHGALCFGTVDSYLVYCLSNGKAYKTDYSNASRTMLLNLDTLDWDEEILTLFGITRTALPALCDSDALFCLTDMDGLFPRPVPVCGVIGDSQAALFANGCVRPHMAKATFGTGTSVMLNVGKTRRRPYADVVESIGWRLGGEVDYVLEGNINYTGALIKWLIENMRLLGTSKEAGRIAASVEDTGGVYFVPAFSGLGAPYWKSDVRALLCGLNNATTGAHIVRAAEEAIAYQIRDVFEALSALDDAPLDLIFVDGGAKNDEMLMQFVADMLNVRLCSAEIEELSAAGAALIGMLAMGLIDRESALSRQEARRYMPAMDPKRRQSLYRGWKEAVGMLINNEERTN